MKSAAIFLDLTEIDINVLRYVRAMDDLMRLESLLLVHYLELQDTTDDYASHFPNLDRPIEEIIEEEILDKARDAGMSEAKLKVVVHAHGGQEDLLQWIGDQNFDFCVFGKKVVHNGTGVFAGKVARLIDKSVLFVTETSRHSWQKILVPVDFSDYSKQTIDFAAELIQKIEIQLLVLHVYHVSPTYFPFVKEETDDLIEEVRQKAEKRLKGLCKKISEDHEITTELIYAGDKTTATCIYDFARSEHADLIVLGAKGRNDDEEFLIGSVAERLIQSDRDLPVLLVRK